MLRFIKGLFYLLLVLVILAVVTPVLLITFVSPEKIKPELVKALHQATGREVSIQGNLSWTIMPRLGITAKEIHIGNPVGFGSNDFLYAKNADFSVAFKPLLKGQIQMGTVTFDSLNINLIKNIQGQNNWTFKSKTAKTQISTDNDEVNASVETDNSKSRLALKYTTFTLSKIRLENSNIIYDDQQAKKQYKIKNLNFESDNLAYNKAFPIKTTFQLETTQTSTPIDVSLKAEMIANMRKIRLQNIDAMTNQYHWQGWVETGLKSKDLSALNGQIAVSGKNGSFKGIDLYYYTDVAESVINKTAPTRQDTHQTPFNELSATLNIQQGVINNSDLIIRASQIDVTGKGTANLISQQLDYTISLQRLTSGKDIKPRGPALPISVTGSFGDPHIRPDLQAILITAVKDKLEEQLEQHKDEINQKIQQGLQSLLGN